MGFSVIAVNDFSKKSFAAIIILLFFVFYQQLFCTFAPKFEILHY